MLLLTCLGFFSPHFHRESDLFLLDAQDLRAGTEGWLVFDVTAASNHWLVDQKYNLGLRLYVETDDGKPAQPTCSVWGQIHRNWSPLLSPLAAMAGGVGGWGSSCCNFKFPAVMENSRQQKSAALGLQASLDGEASQRHSC